MDDDSRKSDKPKGPRGPRPAGRGADGPAGKSFGGKSFGAKPGGKSFGVKPGGKPFGAKPGGKPFAGKPGGKPFEARGEGKPFAGARPARDGATPRADFSRSDRPQGDRPFNKGPRPGRGDEAGGRPEGKPAFSKERSFSGEKRPFREKREFARDGEAPRQKREFSGERPPRPAGDRPFNKGPRPERTGDGERKPFVRREGGGDAPRSFGSKRHVEARSEGGERPRSYGQKSHGDVRRDDDRPRARQPETIEETGERIAKRLARAGIASRREAEDLLAAGRVRVNGHVLTSPAVNVSTEDRIELDGTEIPAIERTRLFLFHKPAGLVTTNRDPEGRKTVFDVLPDTLPRLMTVGRLDINTEGLLLLTNDGGLSRVLELPTTGWLRRYRVRVHGTVDEKALAGLKDGIAVDGVFYGAIEASLERTQGTNAWLSIGLREGKNREVKNIMGALGLEVTRLIRVSFGPFQLGELEEGQVQELKGKTLRDQLGERLIADSGANFEAPIMRPFSNKPEQARHVEDPAARSVRAPKPLAAEPGEGGLIKSRKRRREDSRDDALGRLSTRPERGSFGGRGDKPGFGQGPRPKPSGGPRERGDDREKRTFEPPKQRKANVWMAPGARPLGKSDTSGAPSKDKPSGRSEGRSRPSSTRPSRTGGDAPRRDGPRRDGPGGAGKGPRGPRKG